MCLLCCVFLTDYIGKMLLLISETYHMLSENSVRQNILDYGPFVIGD